MKRQKEPEERRESWKWLVGGKLESEYTWFRPRGRYVYELRVTQLSVETYVQASPLLELKGADLSPSSSTKVN
jgi:hypothetical protein